MKHATLALLSLALLWPTGATAALETVDEIASCIRRNTPDVTSLQAVEFSSRDRLGEERTTEVSIASHRTGEGYRKVLAQVTAPEDVKDTSFLITEGEDGISMSVYSPGLDEPKSITGGDASGSLFGTDFTYEDFERLQGMNWAAEAQGFQRLEDGSAEDRPAYVLEARPNNSAYARIVAYVDKETCVALRTELYEAGRRLRKVLVADPEHVRPLDDAWFAHDLLMLDMLDQTQTRLVVHSMSTGLELPELDVSVSLPKLSPPEFERPKPEFDDVGGGKPELK